MQFVATRDVRANPAILLGEEGTIVMQNGKPRAICFPLEDGDDPLLAEIEGYDEFPKCEEWIAKARRRILK